MEAAGALDLLEERHRPVNLTAAQRAESCTHSRRVAEVRGDEGRGFYPEEGSDRGVLQVARLLVIYQQPGFRGEDRHMPSNCSPSHVHQQLAVGARELDHVIGDGVGQDRGVGLIAVDVLPWLIAHTPGCGMIDGRECLPT